MTRVWCGCLRCSELRGADVLLRCLARVFFGRTFLPDGGVVRACWFSSICFGWTFLSLVVHGSHCWVLVSLCGRFLFIFSPLGLAFGWFLGLAFGWFFRPTHEA